MTKKILVTILALGLCCGLGSSALAGVLGYSLERASQGFQEEPNQLSAAVVAADALVARPLGLALTIAGTGTFIATLPFSVPSQSVGNAADGLIVKPGGYTFVRPLGKSDNLYEERGLFSR